MMSSHLQALEKKHETLEHRIAAEMSHPARDDQAVRRLKEEKLHLKEKIEKLRDGGAD